MIPLRNTVVFPGMMAPLSLGRAASLAALDEATRSELPLVLLSQQQPDTDAPTLDDLYRIGTLADVVRVVVNPQGNPIVVVRGRQRVSVEKVDATEPALTVSVELLESKSSDGPELEARVLSLKQQWSRLLAALPPERDGVSQRSRGNRRPQRPGGRGRLDPRSPGGRQAGDPGDPGRRLPGSAGG